MATPLQLQVYFPHFALARAGFAGGRPMQRGGSSCVSCAARLAVQSWPRSVGHATTAMGQPCSTERSRRATSLAPRCSRPLAPKQAPTPAHPQRMQLPGGQRTAARLRRQQVLLPARAEHTPQIAGTGTTADWVLDPSMKHAYHLQEKRAPGVRPVLPGSLEILRKHRTWRGVLNWGWAGAMCR